MASSDIVSHFASRTVGEIPISSFAHVDIAATVQQAVEALAATSQSAALVGTPGAVSGILTEHDITTRIAAAPDVWQQPVSDFMTTDLVTVPPTETALDALHAMNNGRFRNLPVLDTSGGVVGNVTHYDMIRLASTHLNEAPADPATLSADHSLLYVDFTGIADRPAVVYEADADLESVLGSMASGEIGLVTIVDGRGSVIGEFSQDDVLRKVAGRVEYLADEQVGDRMTTETATVLPSETIAEGIHKMARHGHRYLVKVNENGVPLGVTTFRDVSEYFGVAFSTLA